MDDDAALSLGIRPFGSIALRGSSAANFGIRPNVVPSFDGFCCGRSRSCFRFSLSAMNARRSSSSRFSLVVNKRSGSFFFTTTSTATGSNCFFSANLRMVAKSIFGAGAGRFLLLARCSSRRRCSSSRLSASGSYRFGRLRTCTAVADVLLDA